MVVANPMRGGRITSEERSAISTYVGAGIAVLLAVIGIYFFFLTQKEKKETTTFDPNRPIPSDAVLKSRLKAEEYGVVRGNGSQTPFQNEFWNSEKIGIYIDVISPRTPFRFSRQVRRPRRFAHIHKTDFERSPHRGARQHKRDATHPGARQAK